MITDTMLMQGAAELATAMNESLPNPQECDHRFSPRFEKRIKQLTRKTNYPILYRCLRSIASVLLVVIIGFCSVLAGSAEARATVFGWVKKQYQSLYEYFFTGEIVAPETATYYPGWLPDNCEFVASYETAGGEVYIYSTAQESFVQFSYISDPDVEKMYMDGIQADKKAVMVNGCLGEIYFSHNEEETNNIVWMDESQTILFSISGDYSEEILIKTAENIVEK